METVETVSQICRPESTSLKRGVNETELFVSCAVLALPKKSIRSGTSRLVTGSAGALARSTLNPKPLDVVTVSRFALIAGEGARAPSISLSVSAIPLFG